MSLRARLLSAGLRLIEKPALARAEHPREIRPRFERTARLLFHAPRGTQMQWQVLEAGQHRAEVLEVVPPDLTSDGVIFYIHGGGFMFGSPRTHAAMLAQLARPLGMRAVLPRYRLAPEDPFPAGPRDVRTAWDALCASGVDPARVVLGGDSAGGALAFSLLAGLIADKAPLPAGTFGFSPLTDLTYSGASLEENAAAEALLPAHRSDDLAQMYLQGHPADDPRASPLFADFAGASPVWLTVGSTELLRDDSRRLAAKLREEKVEVTFDEEPGLPHVWPIFHNTLPEARATFDRLRLWIRARLG